MLLALGADQLVNRRNSNDHTVKTKSSFAVGGGGAPGHIRRAVTRLGPNFVKIGQALASRPDLVGEAIAGELLLLQDAMPLFSNDVAREFIYEVSVECFVLFSPFLCAPFSLVGSHQVYVYGIGRVRSKRSQRSV